MENSTFTGKETITLRALEDTSEILFHVQNISINEHSISVRSANPNASQLDIVDKYNLDGGRYRIVLGQHLEKDEAYNLDLSFDGHLNHQLRGFYKTSYRDGRSER